MEGAGGRDPAAAGKQREVFAEFPRKLLREVRRQIQKYFVMETRPREIKYRDEEDEVALKPGSHRLLPKGKSAATVTDFSTSWLRETGFSFASPLRRNLRVETLEARRNRTFFDNRANWPGRISIVGKSGRSLELMGEEADLELGSVDRRLYRPYCPPRWT